MFDTPVINVAMGLVFCFGAVALAASTFTEAIASLLKLRANTLLAGVQKMLNDPAFTGLAQQVYNHALVHPQGAGQMPSRSRIWTYSGPSYIHARDFATAAVDVLQSEPGNMAHLEARIAGLDPQLRQLLQGMLVRAAGDMDRLREQIADWFDTSMDRLSGNYKRRAQLITFAIGLVLSAGLNVDAAHVAQVLWQNPVLARQVADRVTAAVPPAGAASGAASDTRATLQQLEALPVGWAVLPACQASAGGCMFGRTLGWAVLLGWVVTAVASVFGAPFWFDVLQKLVQLRGAGPKPPGRKAD